MVNQEGLGGTSLGSSEKYKKDSLEARILTVLKTTPMTHSTAAGDISLRIHGCSHVSNPISEALKNLEEDGLIKFDGRHYFLVK